MENSRELDGVVHGYRAKLGIRHRSGIGAKTKDRCILTGDRLPKGRTVREVLVHNLIQLGMGEVELPPNDCRRDFDSWMFQRVAKSVSTNHSCRAHDYKAFLVCCRNVHATSLALQRSVTTPPRSSASCKCALLDPIDVQQPLRKQPCAV